MSDAGPHAPPPSTDSPADAALAAALTGHLAIGADTQVLELLMERFGDVVLEACRTSLADLVAADPSLVGEARHDTFVEAFLALNPLRAMPDPRGFMLGIVDRVCRQIRKYEQKRRLPRDAVDASAGASKEDWRALVRWEIEVLLQETPDARRVRDHNARRPSIWPAVILGIVSTGLLLVMWHFRG